MKKFKKNKPELSVDRRSFLAKSSLALTSLGLSPLISAEILNDLAQMVIPGAHAQSTAPAGKRRFVSLHLRAGAPLQELTPPPSWVPSVTNTINTAVNFHTDMAAISATATSSGRLTYLPSTAAALVPHADSIASTYAGVQMDGHSSIWSNQTAGMRVDDNNIPAMAPPSPTVFNAAKNQTGSPIAGVFFNASGDSVVNSKNMYSDLGRVTNTNMAISNADDFVALFGPKALRFTNPERDAVLRAVGSLGDTQLGRLKSRLTSGSVDEAKKSQGEAITLMQTNVQAAIISDYNAYNAAATASGLNIAPPRGMGYPLQKALALSAVSFTRNLAQTTQLAINITDFHGFNSTDRTGNLLPAQVATYLANNLANFIAYMKATDDPINPGTKLWDNTVISITTEFWRDSILSVGSDNGDGGMNGVIWMGGPVKGGTLGDASGQTGGAQGFNPTTGALGGELLHPASIYRTTLSLLGHAQADVSAAMGAQSGMGYLVSAAMK
ncbi:MAG: hypothetical protein ABL958_12515 [Bdellovibrionia bacterium]